MTPKEALRRIKKSVGNHGWFEYEEIEAIETTLNELEALTTPPTADEVCKALSEYLDKNVEYHNRFGFICNDRVIICLYHNNTLSFNDNYPAHIHNIVGKFYEGEIK